MDDPSDPSSQISAKSCACSHTGDNSQAVYTLKLDKAYSIDAVLVIGEISKKLVGGIDIHIGNDPDFKKNPKCPGSPYLTCENPPCDQTIEENWQNGFNAWCGPMPGQYVSLVR